MGNIKYLIKYSNTIFCSTGVLYEDGTINNSESIKRLAEVSLAYAKAGKYHIHVSLISLFL